VKISEPACALADAISLASVIKRGGNSPCFAHLATTGDAVSITCTENTVGTIATSVSATTHETGEIAVPIDRLAALLPTLAADSFVDIEVTAGGVIVVSGTSRLRLPAVSVAESPPAIAIEQEIGRVEIGSADCLQLMEPLAVADTGSSRPYLAGVFWQSLNGRLVATSTDGRRLIRTTVAASKFSENRGLIVPTQVAIAARRLLQKSEASRVTLRRSRGLIAFDAPSFSFTARLIDSSFPAYESLIPSPVSNSVLCSRRKLIAALSRLGAAAPNIDIALVALSWGNGSLLDLHLARSPLDGADVVEAEVHGSAEVALSLPQFTALLKEFDGERVLLETANGLPVVIQGAGEKLALMVRSKWNFEGCGKKIGGQSGD
jgi:DNA polymerase III subunit beta